MVNVNAGPEVVHAYVKEQASKGRDHVLGLVRSDLDAVAGLIAGLDEEDANFKPNEAEFSISEVIQHLNGSFERSKQRLETLSSGKPWQNQGPGPGPGSIPEPRPGSFAEVRSRFEAGAGEIVSILEKADPDTGLDLTAAHATFGEFNWLEWAAYSHHVHTHDHIGQLEQIKRGLAKTTSGP